MTEDLGFDELMSMMPEDERPLPLTLASLESMDEDRLGTSIVWYAMRGMSPDFDDQVEVLATLPPEFGRVYAAVTLCEGVQSGGLLVHFFNVGGDMLVKTLEELRALGADKHAAILERAIALFAEKEEELLAALDGIEESEDGMVEIPNIPEFQALDDEFDDVAGELEAITLDFIKANLAKFAVE
jgi:Domain of unknown function (DUF4375)